MSATPSLSGSTGTSTDGWTALPPTITPSIWQSLIQYLKPDLRALAADAGLRYRIAGHTVMVRLDPVIDDDLVYVKPLQSSDGKLKKDFAEILTADAVDIDLSHNLRPQLQANLLAGTLTLAQLGSFQAALYSAPDPKPVLLEILADNPYLRLFRIGSRQRLANRLLIWRIMTQLATGTGPQDLKIGVKGTANPLITGLVELLPASIVCAPLIARLQPLAAVLMTSRGAEIAVVSSGAFTRPFQLTTWPVGTRVSLGGPGKGAYKTRTKRIRPGFAEEMLYLCVKGTNRLLRHLTDPAAWSNAGIVDIDERWIGWMSVRLGLDAINSIGSEWTSDAAFWSALRALGILQGIWEGRTHKVPLSSILDPRLVRNAVLPVFSISDHRDWAEDVLSNYEGALHQAFPGDTLEDLLPKFEELRHLVHGVGAQASKKRARSARLDTLRALAEHSPNVQLLVDVAVFWWTAVLFDPGSLCREGFMP
jgi:hypothetical protein